MHVLVVQVVRGHGVGNRVARHVRRPLPRVPDHVLRVDLDGVVPELVLGHGLEPLRSLGEVRVALDPAEGVEVDAAPAAVLGRLAVGRGGRPGGVRGRGGGVVEADLLAEVEAVDGRAALEEGPVEEVAVVRHDDLF